MGTWDWGLGTGVRAILILALGRSKGWMVDSGWGLEPDANVAKVIIQVRQRFYGSHSVHCG